MGAGVTMAHGFSFTEKDSLCISFIGDSTFFASGITGAINAVYNKSNTIICVLDNRITAMTGGQDHPGTGKNILGEEAEGLDIKKILEAIGVKVWETDPRDKSASLEKMNAAIKEDGVRAVIFKAPCITFLRKIK
jgi:indolepyruvate ferredoxin oxidoreductase alpha subunit